MQENNRLSPSGHRAAKEAGRIQSSILVNPIQVEYKGELIQ